MTKKKKAGLDWLVAARGYALLGIFIGHLMLPYIEKGADSLLFIAQSLQVICIPIFMILTGAFYSRGTQKFGGYTKLKFCQRMFPVYFYLLLILPFYYLFDPNPPTNWLRWIPFYLLGIPMLSWPTWFLIGLFSAELMYFFIQPKLKSRQAMLTAATAIYTGGWLFHYYKFSMPRWVDFGSMIFMLQTTMIFIAFFLIGAICKKPLLKMSHWGSGKLLAYAIAAFTIMIPAVMFNTEFPAPPEGDLRSHLNQEMVMIFVGQYGNYFLFMLSCLAGVFGFLCVVRLIPVTQFMRTCGDYSLLLLGINAIFHQVLNQHFVQLLPLPTNELYWSLSYTVVIGTLSFVVSLPVAITLQKYFPQLTGKPMLKGPILPALYKNKSKE